MTNGWSRLDARTWRDLQGWQNIPDVRGHLLDADVHDAIRAVDDSMLRAIGVPSARLIDAAEGGDAGDSDGRGEMHRAGVMANEEARPLQGGAAFARQKLATGVDDDSRPVIGDFRDGLGLVGRAEKQQSIAAVTE